MLLQRLHSIDDSRYVTQSYVDVAIVTGNPIGVRNLVPNNLVVLTLSHDNLTMFVHRPGLIKYDMRYP
jgi:hypothetical protein